MSDRPKPPPGPAGWRQLGLLALLGVVAVLLLLRGCGPEAASEPPAAELRGSAAATG